jgi:hypothetical protein
MADVDITCRSCGRSLSVSEVVEVTSMKCPSCGQQAMTRSIPLGGGDLPSPENRPKQKLRLKEVSYEPTIKEPEPDPASEKKKKKKSGKAIAQPSRDIVTTPSGTVDLQELQERNRAERERRKAPFMGHGLAAWGVFFVLGGICTLLRYGPGWNWGVLQVCLPYAWIVILFFHIVAIILAAEDNLIHGVLAFIVPGYSFYYIFQLYESYMLRAVTAALLIAFGQDGALQIWEVVVAVANDLHALIGSGGGEVKRLPQM